MSGATTTRFGRSSFGEVLDEHRRRVEVVERDVEEALDLGAVQIHGQRAVGAGDGDQVGDQLGGDRRARLVLAVLARVAEVRHHRGDAARRGALGGVEHDQQLHQVIRRRVRGLHDEHVAAADVLVEAHRDFAVLEARHLDVTERHLELLADGMPPGAGWRCLRRCDTDPSVNLPKHRCLPVTATATRGDRACAQRATRHAERLRAGSARTSHARADPAARENGWGGRIRTSECEIQSLVPYRLATPHQQNGISVTVRSARGPPGVLALGPENYRMEKSGTQHNRAQAARVNAAGRPRPREWRRARRCGARAGPAQKLCSSSCATTGGAVGCGQLSLVLGHHLVGQVLPGDVVDRVREVLVLTVRSLAARHGDEQPGVALDDLEPRTTKESFSVMLTNAFNFSSFRSETLTSVISIMKIYLGAIREG